MSKGARRPSNNHIWTPPGVDASEELMTWVDCSRISGPWMGASNALATMESRAWGAYQLPVSESDMLVIGASPRRSDR